MTTSHLETAVLEARALSVGYGHGRDRTVVLEGLDLALRSGRLIGLLGANGSGKSTLLRTLGGMQPPLAGEVLLEGRPLHELAGRERARRLAMVLTERVRPGAMTVAELVSLGRLPHVGWAGRLLAEDREAIGWALERADVEALAERTVTELSDGERQRVMIARALAQEPAVLMLDEPTAFLDPPRRLEVVTTLRRLVEEEGLAVLVASHDLEVLLPVVDRVWLLVPEGDEHRLVRGGPEDLALAGALERAFAREEQRWDERRGTFVSLRPLRGRVRVEAEGARRLWAERALERAGWQSDQASGEITLRAAGDRWQLEAHGRSSELDDLAAVVDSLRAEAGDSRAGESVRGTTSPGQRKISSSVPTPSEKRS